MDTNIILESIHDAIGCDKLVEEDEISFITVGKGDSRRVVPINLIVKGDEHYAQFKTNDRSSDKLYRLSSEKRRKILDKISSATKPKQNVARDPSLDIRDPLELPKIELLGDLATVNDTPNGESYDDFIKRLDEIDKMVTSEQSDAIRDFSGMAYTDIKKYQVYDLAGKSDPNYIYDNEPELEGMRELDKRYNSNRQRKFYTGLIQRYIDKARHIQEFITNAPKAPGIVFRGLCGLEKDVIDKFMAEDTFEFDSISSTSRKLRKGINFAGMYIGSAIPITKLSNVLLKLHQKNAVPIEHLSSAHNEAELIMPAGSKFKVIKKMRANDGIVIEAEEID